MSNPLYIILSKATNKIIKTDKRKYSLKLKVRDFMYNITSPPCILLCFLYL